MAEETENTEEVTETAEAEAPVSDTETVSDTEPEAAAPAQAEPKKKRKRVPRAERPKKGRRVRTPATERKAIVRLPKPEHERGRTQERRGIVVSSAMDKTIVVKVERRVQHPIYKKFIRRSKKYHAHDELNAFKGKVGENVKIRECRPMSKTKSWEVLVDGAKA